MPSIKNILYVSSNDNIMHINNFHRAVGFDNLLSHITIYSDQCECFIV